MAHYVCCTGGRGLTDIDSVRTALRILHGFHGDELRVIHGVDLSDAIACCVVGSTILGVVQSLR